MVFSTLLPPGDIVLITRRDPGEPISERTAARLFLKEKQFWKDGTRIVPVNLPPDDAAREQFTRTVLRRSHRELVEFWNQEHFRGNNPPVVLQSEDAVKAFVRQVEGAVGYIHRDRLDADLKVLLVVPGS